MLRPETGGSPGRPQGHPGVPPAPPHIEEADP